jgi:hypothetical protein
LTAALGRTPFDYWILGEGRGNPSLDAIDTTIDGQWRFHFHGLEVDVRHAIDGRAVRIDFGPGGTPAFTPGGVGAFAIASRPPWRDFPDLKATLSGAVGYDHARCVNLCDDLRHHRLAEWGRLEARPEGFTRVVFRTPAEEVIVEGEMAVATFRSVCARLAVVLGGAEPPLYGTNGPLDVVMPFSGAKGRFEMINTPGKQWFRIEAEGRSAP